MKKAPPELGAGLEALLSEEDFPNAFKYLEDALKVAEELNHIPSLFMANFWLASALSYSCEFEKALYHFEKALEINVAANSTWGIVAVKSNMALHVPNFQGELALGYQTSDEALRIAEDTGDIYSKAHAYTVYGSSCYCKGLFEEAEGYLLKAADFCERMNLFQIWFVAHWTLGETYFDRREYRKSQDHYNRAIFISEYGRLARSLTNSSKIALARARVMNNEKDINLSEIFERYEASKWKVTKGWMARHVGEILLNIDNQHMDEAEDWIKKAIEADKRNGMMWYLGRDYASYAELLKRKGDLSGARENLNTAIQILKECGADGWVKRYEKEVVMFHGPSFGGHDKDIIRYTSCGFHCFDQCVLKVRVRDGTIVSVEPDDTINPGIAREGEHLPEKLINTAMIQRRPCAKGYAMAQEIYDPNRVKYPMKRVGKRGEAKFERISWDEALDTIAGKLVEIKEKYGPYSILHQPYSYLGMCSFPLAQWFGAGIAGWAAHSTNGWEEPQHWVLGKDYIEEIVSVGSFELTQDETNIFKSRLIVLWGLNPVSLMNSGVAYNLLQAKERGIPIICIDPRYTPSVEVLADQWIPIRPTTDVAMMIAMANVWFKEDLCDKEFVNRWVEPEGLRRWKDYVLGMEDGIDKTPQWAETICGVPAETIERFARLYARSKPVNLNVSLSMGRQFYGENPTRAAMYLQALTGNTCIPGGTAAAETGLWWGPLAGPMPGVDWQQKLGSYFPPVLMAMYKWPKAIDMRERLDKGEISKEEYNNMIGNAPGQPAPNIKMVILESNNHLNNLPDINQTIRALKKADFVLVFAQYADMPSARYADILIPQIYSAFEGRNGGCGWTWGLFTTMISLGNFFVYRQKCVDPPGEVKPNDWVWTQIAKRLGIVEQFNPRMANVPDEEWDEAIEELYQEAYEKWAAMQEIAPMNPPSWEEFQKKPVFRYEMEETPYYPFKKRLERGENPFKGTESGKIEFYSKVLAQGPQYLAMNEVPPGSGKCYGGGNLPPMAQMTMGGRDTFYSENAEKYPLLMSSPHSYYRMHSFLDNSPWLSGDCYRHAVWMSVADAKARGIMDNDLVKVYNDIGEVIIPAYVTSRIVPGTVAIHHGGWYKPSEEESQLMPDGIDRRGAPNLLTHEEDLPVTIVGMFPCKGLVQIEKWEGV